MGLLTSVLEASMQSSITSVVSMIIGGLLLATTLFYSSSLSRWLRRKRYQYDVTIPLYMLTPTEQFILNSFIFLFLSLIIIAASLYLPSHISKIASRAYYYYAGDVSQQSSPAQSLGSATGAYESLTAAPNRENLLKNPTG